MPWTKTPEDRRRDNAVYGSAEYRKNRAIARRRAGGVCEQCQHRHPKLQCDHIIPKSQGGGNALSNLRMLCVGEGSCKCHEAKSLTESSGYRKSGRKNTDPPCRPRTQWLCAPDLHKHLQWRRGAQRRTC